MKPFDWDALEIGADIDKIMHRVSGECICKICSKPYWKHPMELRVLDYNGDPYLHRLCDGRLGKL